MRHRTFPKDGMKKLKEQIKDLKDLINRQAKEIRFLHNEILNRMKPIRDRKTHVDKDKLSNEDWKKDFLKRLKAELWDKK